MYNPPGTVQPVLDRFDFFPISVDGQTEIGTADNTPLLGRHRILLLNGVEQQEGISWSIDSSNEITWLNPSFNGDPPITLETGDEIRLYYSYQSTSN